MDRRAFLAGLAGAVGGFGGCLAAPVADGSTPLNSGETYTLAQEGFPRTICEEDINRKFSIRAVVDPAFAADWSGRDIDPKYTLGEEGLPDRMTVIGLVNDDAARAYPLSVVWYHEIINDRFGAPVLVTFCSICRTGMTAVRRVNDEETVFGVSGLLWQAPAIRTYAAEERGEVFGATMENASADLRNSGNLVMYDEATESYWSQVLATAICGPMEGTDLELIPSTLTTWGDWHAEHPETDVLLPPPYSTLME